MNLEYTKEKEVDLSGWWTGSIYVDQGSISDEALDPEIDDVDRRMIHSILGQFDSDKSHSEGHGGEDVVSVSYLDSYLREQIEQQIRDGNDFGTVWCDGEDISWNLEIECTLEGRDVDWWDLSDASREHIAHGIIEDNWKQGEICELGEIREHVQFEDYTPGGNTRGYFEYTDSDGEVYSGNWEWEREAGCQLLLDLESLSRSVNEGVDLSWGETAAIESMVTNAVEDMDARAKEQEKGQQKKSGRGM